MLEANPATTVMASSGRWAGSRHQPQQPPVVAGTVTSWVRPVHACPQLSQTVTAAVSRRRRNLIMWAALS